ncbi:alkaline phosphatase [Corynebacterium renale]|nr:alkaline phosphatase [Corynebacterium renale]STD00029.1 alkaline phosphatase [Corynebacterium renale]
MGHSEGMRKYVVALASACALAAPAAHAVELAPVGTYASGVFGKSAAEIVAFHASSQRILTVNAQSGQVDVLDAADVSNLSKVGTISAGGDKEINSVAVRADGLAVAAVQQGDKTAAGEALFFDVTTLTELGRVSVGSLPDNVHITADGRFALVANEGEPSDEMDATGEAYAVDPEGSVSVITLPGGIAAPAQSDVRTADFRAYDGNVPAGVRVFGPAGHHNLASRDFEPEYISSVGGTAFVTLQENNAIAMVDIENAEVTDVVPAYVTDHRQVPLDPSNKDGKVELRTQPVKGLSMPDSIAAFEVGGATYFATANEGDAREWGTYTDEVEFKDLVKEGLVCESAVAGWDLHELAAKEQMGNLKLTNASGWNEELGCFDDLHAYGSRSFTIYDAHGNAVFDSGSDFERITADLHARCEVNFNANNDENDPDDRSDNKGPEPEALTVGRVGERTYAFIGAERVGGVFVYDVTVPAAAKYVTYVNNRNFEAAPDSAEAGDLGPEGFAFVSAEESPSGEALLVVGNEVSGTTTVYEVRQLVAPSTSSSGGGIAAAVIGVLAALLGLFGLAHTLLPHVPRLF